jgi:hypothetical protein
MRAGDLHDKLDIYSVVQTVNIWGDFVETETIRFSDVRCSVLHMGTPSAGASEFTDDDQRVGEMKIEFKCRYLSGIEFSDVIYYNGGRFNVYSILPIGKREGMRVRARRRDNTSDSNPAD